jgi:hypothetical protein
MSNNLKSIEKIRVLLSNIENDVESLKKILFNDYTIDQSVKLSNNSTGNNDSQIVEGVFNGEIMIDSNNKEYHVPQNYASKSKLVPGDILKLTILADGTFIYKQIGPVDRCKLVGTVIEKNGKFQVEANDKKYNVLQSSITYFKVNSGDKITIVVPKNHESNWAAIENLIGE